MGLISFRLLRLVKRLLAFAESEKNPVAILLFISIAIDGKIT